MLYLYHGTDTQTSANKARALVKSLRAKHEGAAFAEMDSDHWSISAIQENAGGQGLFYSKHIIFLDRVTDNVEAKDQIGDMTSVMKESSNIFIVLEGKLNADLKKSLEKYAEKVVVSDVKEKVGGKFVGKGGGKEEFNIFALGDALGNRDSFKAWSIYRQAIDAGLELESIIGTLFWQVKSIVVANETTSASASGLSPFVYSKSKKYAGNYSKDELKSLAKSLVTIYHDGHRGLIDMELGVERLLLNLRK